MEQMVLEHLLAQVRDRLEHDDIDGAVRIIESLRPADQAELFSELPPEQQEDLLTQLDIEDSADILEKLEDEEAAELASQLDIDTLASILDEMEPDEAADLLGDLPPEQVFQALSHMADADEVRPLLLHPDETAGGLMTSEFLALRQDMTAAQALAAIRQWAPEREDIHYFFVVNQEGKLVGVVSLTRLLVADPWVRLRDLMDPDVIHVHTSADQEKCARLMARYDLLALPVVDDEGHLVGVITVDDLVDVLEDEATEDIQRLGGAEPLGRPYLDTNVVTIAWKRVGWLLLLFVTATLTGTVMRFFQQELDRVVALTFFIPLLIGTGGNAGSQTTATVIRALAVGDISTRDALRVLWHEMRAGVLLGLMLSGVAFLRAITWGTGPNLALAVGVSILAVVVWATSVGALLPVAATKVGIDPTVISGPFMSTLVDATGLLIYFSIAKVILGL